jgi:acyl dehydratase
MSGRSPDSADLAPDITHEMLDQARSMVGVWLRRDVHVPAFAEDISPIDIRRWAQYSMGDDNPLWSNDHYARGTRWGGVIAPPCFLYSIDSTIVAPGLRGIQWIYGGTRWENHVPVRIGDRISARARVIRVEEKSGAHAQTFLVQTGEVLYTNQRDELVARAEADVMRIPRRRSGRGIKGFEERERSGRAKYTPEEIEEIRQAYLNEVRRGSEPRYWEDVEVGESLPPVVKGPLTLVDIMAFYVGRRNTYAPLKLAFLDRERHPANVYISPSTGIPMHPAGGHFDDEIAREVGMPGAYDQGWMRANWMSHLVTNWCGDDGWVSALGFRLKKPNLVGDTTWCHGTVLSKGIDSSGRHSVELEIWGQTQRGERNVEGRATVLLPSRATAG